MTSCPRASPASWPNPAPVPASPRSAPLFEPLCPPVAWGSPTQPVMCCGSPPSFVSVFSLNVGSPGLGSPHTTPPPALSREVIAASASLGPWEASQEDSLLPQPRSPRRCVLSPCGPTRTLNPRGAARCRRAAASGSQSCPAFPFSVHFGIWTLPVPLWPRFCVVFHGCVFFRVSVSTVRGPPAARLSAPFARSP